MSTNEFSQASTPHVFYVVRRGVVNEAQLSCFLLLFSIVLLIPIGDVISA